MGSRSKFDGKIKGNSKLLVIEATFGFVSFASRRVIVFLPLETKMNTLRWRYRIVKFKAYLDCVYTRPTYSKVPSRPKSKNKNS